MNWIKRPLLVTAIGYPVLSVFAVGALYFARHWFQFSPTYIEAAFFLLFLNFVVAVFFAWVVDSVPLDDRALMLKMVAIYYLPTILMLNTIMFALVSELYEPHFAIANLLIALSVVFGVIWALLVSPFLRQHAIKKSIYPEKMRRAIVKWAWPIKSEEEFVDIEIHISPRVYFTLFVGLISILVLVIESLVGEFLDETLGLPGYSGAIILGLGVTAGIYPIHKRISKYAIARQEHSAEFGATDLKSVSAEVARSMRQLSTSMRRYKYVILPWLLASAVVGALAAWIAHVASH